MQIGPQGSRIRAAAADTTLTLPRLRANTLRYPASCARYCTRRERQARHSPKGREPGKAMPPRLSVISAPPDEMSSGSQGFFETLNYLSYFAAYPFQTHSMACGRNCAWALPTLWPELRQNRY